MRRAARRQTHATSRCWTSNDCLFVFDGPAAASPAALRRRAISASSNIQRAGSIGAASGGFSYASVNCALTLTQSYVRRGAGGYGNNPQDDASNFAPYPAAVKSIVTSSSQADSGLFEANLRDERYLPFEAAGVISSWAIELLGKPRAFDYDTIADLILTIRYTARPDGSRASAEQSAEQWLKNNSACVFSMRHEFGTEWSAFKRAPTAADGRASLKFSLGKQHFPYRLVKMTQPARQMHLFSSGNASGDMELLRNSVSVGTTQLVNGATFESAGYQPTGDFELKFSSNMLDDLWIVVDWSVQSS